MVEHFFFLYFATTLFMQKQPQAFRVLHHGNVVSASLITLLLCLITRTLLLYHNFVMVIFQSLSTHLLRLSQHWTPSILNAFCCDWWSLFRQHSSAVCILYHVRKPGRYILFKLTLGCFYCNRRLIEVYLILFISLPPTCNADKPTICSVFFFSSEFLY